MGMAEEIRKLAATVVASQYKVYNRTITGNTPFTDANNLINIGADLKTAYGKTLDVPATAGFIYSSADIQIKFNDLTNDQLNFDISEWGKIYTINRGDLLVYKIYFGTNIPTGSAGDATIQVFMSGTPLEEA